jgi:glycine oxidase
MQLAPITVAGAGVIGLWQALTLARRGHRVRLVEQSAEPFTQAASAYAGAMLGPYCETEAEALAVRDLGLAAIGLWRRTCPATVVNGTLVLAHARDASEIERFARLTEGHARLDAAEIRALEPDLGGRFSAGLFYAEEAHVPPLAGLRCLLEEARRAGVEVLLGTPWHPSLAQAGTVIDCRGMGAQAELPDLRGVRGERLVVRTREITFQRPVRLLHPRHPLYVVPWGGGLFMLGASVIESEEQGPVTVRSALELLSMAYALHPGFAEAQIMDMGAGVRPALPDNIPKILVRGSTLHVNGTYRHGFLLAPALAELVADYLATGAVDSRVFGIAS